MDDVRVEVAFQYTTGEEERVRCYANNAHNPGGGTHLSGFRTALTRALTAYGNKENLFKNDSRRIGEDFREGITAVVSIAGAGAAVRIADEDPAQQSRGRRHRLAASSTNT